MADAAGRFNHIADERGLTLINFPRKLRVMPTTINELLAKAGSQFSLAVFHAKGNGRRRSHAHRKRTANLFSNAACATRKSPPSRRKSSASFGCTGWNIITNIQSPVSVEYAITFGRDTSKRADIVVFDADRPTVPYLIVEVKQPTEKGGKDQLKSYTHATGAPLALWSDGLRAVIWHRKNPNYFVVIPDLPTAKQTIEDIAGQPWTIDTLIEKEKQRRPKAPKPARSAS